jgi:uncharacterized protein (DUF1684 family)
MHRDASTLTLLGILAACLGAAATSAADGESFGKEQERWRRQREADLKADDGWLTVCGLSWLRPGETRIGSDPGNDILLPAHAPASVGTLTLDAATGRATFRPAQGVAITRNRQPFEPGELHSDADARPDILAVGDVRLILLKRGERMALRIKDNRSPARARFAGLRWYPAAEDWRIPARFVAYPTPTMLTFETIVGERDTMESPGYVTFERGGKEYRLQAARVKGGGLWFVFRDATSGRTTHGGARQLTAEPPKGNEVVLDFNKAVNLPCAYIPYATCPLAPPQNRLTLAVEAGEKMYEPGKPADTDTASR